MAIRRIIRRWLKDSYPAIYKKAVFLWPQPKLRGRILRDLKRHPERYGEPELAAAAGYVRRNGTVVFPHPFAEKYASLPVEVREDGSGGRYVYHNGKRLYFPRTAEPAKIAGSYRALLREQDPESPHCYLTAGFGVDEGTALFDIGAAEGIFALDNVEKASRVFLFETDPAWVEPLEKTFKPWKDKVVIINKFASNADGAETVTVDSAVREYGIREPLFLKLDVEGAEEDVLRGTAQTLSRKGTKAVVCTYHREGDHSLLSAAMRSHGFEVETSHGYMLFVFDRTKLNPPFFRRGVIYCTK